MKITTLLELFHILKKNYPKMEIVSIIPARGGSKGIKKKNLIDLNGKPLLSYGVNASLSCLLYTSDAADE